jgi:hypothetical protein
MVHSYLTASKENSIDKKQEGEWQAIINESDSFLVGLFFALFVFVVLRIFNKCMRHRCLRKICVRKCPCLDKSSGNGGNRPSALEMYSIAANGGGAAKKPPAGIGDGDGDGGGGGSGSGSGSGSGIVGTNGSDIGGGIGGGSGGELFLHDNPVFQRSPRARKGRVVRVETSQTREQKEYETAHKKHQLTRQNSKSAGGGGAGGETPLAFFVKEFVTAAQLQDLVTAVHQEEDGQHGGGHTRRRMVDACSELCDESTLKFLCEMGEVAREALKQRAGGAGEEKMNIRTRTRSTGTGKSTAKRRQGGFLSGGSRRWATRKNVPLVAAGVDSVGIVVEGDGAAAPSLAAAGGGRESCNPSQNSDGTRNSVPRRGGGESDRGSASGARSGSASPAEGKDGRQEASRSKEYVEL